MKKFAFAASTVFAALALATRVAQTMETHERSSLA